MHVELTVRKRERLAENVVLLQLARSDGGALPVWEPGAHLELQLENGLVRQYSLCGDTFERSVWSIAVLNVEDGRGGSGYIHESLQVGSTVTAGPPRNNFALVENASYLFIAGGIGITPIVPMIAAAEKAGAEWRLIYGGRSRDSMAFLGQLLSTYGPRVEVWAEDEVGRISNEAITSKVIGDCSIYCCGPEGLIRAVESATADLSADTLHVERFAPKEDLSLATGEAFEVELARSGVVVTVPKDRTVLEVLEEVPGIVIPSSCQEGTCGTCETKVLSGTVDHRDSLLSAEERAANDTMFVCVSRAHSSRLVLDL